MRDQVQALGDAGLAPDEAFLVGVKRMGSQDALSREFAREHSERLWKQLVLASGEGGGRSRGSMVEMAAAVCLAVAAALAVKAPELFGYSQIGYGDGFYPRNISLLVLPLLTGFFVWKRRTLDLPLSLAGPSVRCGRPLHEPGSLRAARTHGGARGAPPADRALGWP